MRVCQRVARLEGFRDDQRVCAVCASLPWSRVVYELDGERMAGQATCPACHDRSAIVVDFVATPRPDGSVPPTMGDTRWLAVLAGHAIEGEPQ
ncbi:MAG: hypothetical protein AB7G11_17565 [Phycisphaerales bacterium]